MSDVYNNIKYYAEMKRNAQIKKEALNKDYWKQDNNERIRRDSEKSGCMWELGYSTGALTILINRLGELTNLSAPTQDMLGEEDILKAITEEGGKYWKYIKSGGLLNYEVWVKASQEFADLLAIPDTVDFNAEQWKRFHELQDMLGEEY